MVQEGKLFGGTLLLGASAAVGKVVSFLLLPFFTSTLSPSEFGVCELFISTAALLISVCSLYAPQATFRFLVQGVPGSARIGVGFLIIGTLLFSLTLPFLGRIPVLRPYLFLLFCFVVASLLRSFASHILRAKGQFLLFSAQQLFCTLFTVLAQIFLLRYLHLGVRGYLWGIVLGDGLTALLLLFSLLPYRKRGGRWDRALCGQMLRFSFPLILTALLWWGMSNADRYILLYYHGRHATGVYAAAMRFPALITFAASVFLEVWHYGALQGEQERREARFGRMYALLLPSFFVLGGSAIAFSPLLVRLFLSEAYANAAQLLGFLLFGAVCAGMAGFLDSAYSLQMRTAPSFYTSALATGVHLALSFLFIPSLGAIGAAVAAAMGYFVLFFVRVLHTAHLLKFSGYVKSLFASLLFLFGAGILLAYECVFWGVLSALFSILPLWGHVLDAVIFLWERSRAFLEGARKKEKYIEKKRKI